MLKLSKEYGCPSCNKKQSAVLHASRDGGEFFSCPSCKEELNLMTIPEELKLALLLALLEKRQGRGKG
jgi:hypothetical protein